MLLPPTNGRTDLRNVQGILCSTLKPRHPLYMSPFPSRWSLLALSCSQTLDEWRYDHCSDR